MSMAGQPVLGSTLQPGGLVLQLTLLHATTGQPLSDAHNPRPGEGLFLGKGGQQFETTVKLTKSTHKFEFKVMLMSSDIGGALVKIKVAPPNAADDDPLCVITRAFKSRARSNINEPCYKRTRPAKRSSAPDAPNIDKDRVVRRKSARLVSADAEEHEIDVPDQQKLNEFVDGLYEAL